MLSERLTEAFESVAEDPPLAVDLRRVLIRAKRRRRRRRALLTGSVVAVAVALETFAGVKITVLPGGLHAAGGPDVTGPLAGNVYALMQTFIGTKEPNKYLPPTLSVTVEKARTDLDALARTQKQGAQWVTISGQRALLVTYDAVNGIPPSRAPGAAKPTPTAADFQRDSRLYWSPSPTSALTLRVEGQAGVSLDETLAVARGLVVDASAPRAPADTSAADAAIKQAFMAAFTGGTPLSIAEAAIQDGQRLTSTLNRLKALHPETADNTKVSIKDISYFDAEHALVAIELSYQFGASRSTGNFWIGALLLGGQWKVSRDNYCTTISLTFVNCPKS